MVFNIVPKWNQSLVMIFQLGRTDLFQVSLLNLAISELTEVFSSLLLDVIHSIYRQIFNIFHQIVHSFFGLNRIWSFNEIIKEYGLAFQIFGLILPLLQKLQRWVLKINLLILNTPRKFFQSLLILLIKSIIILFQQQIFILQNFQQSKQNRMISQFRWQRADISGIIKWNEVELDPFYLDLIAEVGLSLGRTFLE